LQITDPQEYSLPSSKSGVKRLLLVLSGTRIPDTCLKASKQLKHKIRVLQCLRKNKEYQDEKRALFAFQRHASSYEAMIQTGRDYVEMLL